MLSPASPATQPPTVLIPRHILRLGEVERLTGFKRTHLYNLMHAGRFPEARRIGLRAVGWDSFEVEQWIVDRLTRED
ncbi:MAG TPA: AlpA family phage regulatory protein [Pseudomonas sp.]|nr:AlpA family phage regulatory protein [Pseudomonas sp.]